MKKIKLLFFIIFIISCNPKTSKNNDQERYSGNLKTFEKSDSINPVAVAFTERLKTGKKLSPLFSNTWTFIYNEDDRCTGFTSGKVTYSNKLFIDTNMKIKVLNTSEYAWACEKKDPYYYEMTFNLKEKLKKWNKIELNTEDTYSDTSKKEKNVFYIFGAGESDYIKLYINEDNLIHTFKYSIEDPG